MIEQLEPRRLLAGFELVRGTLTYLSDDTPQFVRVRADGDQLVLTASGRTRTMPRSLVRMIRIITGAGNDDIRLTAGLPATIQSGAGDDSISAVTRGSKTIDSASGDDTVRTGSADDSVLAGAGRDSVLTGDGADTLIGGDGEDQLRGGNGHDMIRGGAQADRLLGGDGADTIIGDGGNDRIDTGPGDDVAFGDAGADKLFSTEGNDTLFAGPGDDTLYAGPGAERLTGDDGSDRLSYYYSTVGVNVLDGTAAGGWADGDAAASIESIEAAPMAATLAGSAGSDSLLGNAGDDDFFGAGGDDQLDGAGGSDTARFSGNWRDYDISSTVGGQRIADGRSGAPDGIDELLNVESFAFADGILSAATLLNVGPSLTLLSGGSVEESPAQGTVVATLLASDPNVLDSVTLELVDDAGGRFTLDAASGQLLSADGVRIDFESAASHEVVVRATDARGLSVETRLTIAVNDVNEPPSLAAAALVPSLDEDADTSSPIDVAELTVTDDALGTAPLALAGTDASMFEIVAGRLRLVAGAGLDHEAKSQLDVIVRVDDPSVGASPDAEVTVSLSINNVNEPPTGASLSPGGVNENASVGTSAGTVSGTDVDADDTLSYTLIDDAGGRFGISPDGTLSVADGTLLDYESATSHSIVVRVTDADGLSIDVPFTVSLNDVAGVNFSGTAGNDSYTGSIEPDTINGNNGNDSLSGGGGADTIDGGAGNDTISGDAGNDSLTGAAGTDWVFYVSAPAGVTVDLGAGTASGQGNDTLATFENVRGSNYADTLTGSTAANFLDGLAGNDSLNGGNGNDSLRGGAGSDILNGGAGTDTVYYDTDAAGVSVNLATGFVTQADGTDTLSNFEAIYLSPHADTVIGSSAASTIFDDAGNDSIDGGGGNDTIYAMGGNDTLLGGTGTDRIDFNLSIGSITASLVTGVAASSQPADGTDTFSGFEAIRGSNAGNDSLTGNASANTLLGAGGNDTLAGGAGDDSLSGDAGASDLAVFTGNWSNYTITIVGANYRLVDTRSGSPDGTDLVHNTTERFQFADGIILAGQLVNVAPAIGSLSNATVPQLSATGTVVGTVSASDANPLDTRAFALTDDAGGRFQIDVSTGVLSVLDGSLLVIASQSTHSITVSVTDVHGLSVQQTFTITLTP